MVVFAMPPLCGLLAGLDRGVHRTLTIISPKRDAENHMERKVAYTMDFS
jgi:hypothetical protein